MDQEVWKNDNGKRGRQQEQQQAAFEVEQVLTSVATSQTAFE
jgi:hypothetical protein